MLDKKVIIWDLDNTLYRITPEFADNLDKLMAEALVFDLNVPMDVEEAKDFVKQSYKEHRDGGEYFYNEYGIDPIDLFFAYNRRISTEMIVPEQELEEKIKEIKLEQYIFTASSLQTAKNILEHINLYEFFKGKIYSVENFKTVKKNDSPQVYIDLCKMIGCRPEECIFVDDSYSNLDMAKQAGMTTVRIYYNQNSAGDKEYIDYAYKGIMSFVEDFNNKSNQVA